MNYFNYFSEIEEAFNRRRGKYQFLSPLDWALIESWQKQGMPLHIVLGGIERVFDNAQGQPHRRRSVKSLMYCREEIEAQYEEWRERQIGKNNDETEAAETPEENSLFSAEAISEHLANAVREVRAAAEKAAGGLGETLSRVDVRLAELEKSHGGVEMLEAALNDLEKLIDESLLENSVDDASKAEIEKQLAAYRSKMDADAYRNTFELMLLKRLREKHDIPRLSLFYL